MYTTIHVNKNKETISIQLNEMLERDTMAIQMNSKRGYNGHRVGVAINIENALFFVFPFFNHFSSTRYTQQ